MIQVLSRVGIDHSTDRLADIWDNKVVPTFIDSREHPFASAFFHHEHTACYQQSLQSAIVKPAHGERLSLSGKGCLDGTYSVEGYAFNGGGDLVDRVELSLDGGKTWRYCFRKFVDSPLRCVRCDSPDPLGVSSFVADTGRNSGLGYSGK